jgi:hypothetical protein
VIVYSPGTPVSIGGALDSLIPALIVEVSIRSPDWVQYRVVWWSGRERRSEWLELHEVTFDGLPAEKRRWEICFHQVNQ